MNRERIKRAKRKDRQRTDKTGERKGDGEKKKE